jgi:hypothetical protein
MKSSVNTRLFALAFALLVGLAPAAARAHGQPAPDGSLADARAALVESAEELKERTSELIRVEEEKAATAEATLVQLQKLSAEGLVAKTEVDAAASTLADSRARVEGLRAQLAEANRQVEVAATLAKAPVLKTHSIATRTTGKYSATASMIRFTGRTSSAVAGLAGVQSFYASTFGRALPISAFGQSATHDRYGYDHRHAVDVAVHPDSPQGRALIGYLQSQGITFLAFRTAIPGVATGPHIHIGRPSGRI